MIINLNKSECPDENAIILKKALKDAMESELNVLEADIHEYESKKKRYENNHALESMGSVDSIGL